ncbi:hypothetical protein [Glaciihabitans sp. UYNi722]|uniref:hypothetical protein n=1 Tax=Glaciihabitans sp. UYNi722 TaxID=3156344 RepID=UPI00339A0E15
MPAEPSSGLDRGMQRLVHWGSAVPGLRRILISAVIARPGYWFATVSGVVWGGILSRGQLRSEGGVVVAQGCPRWAFGRGGTTIGAVYLTHDNVSLPVLRHEAVHRAQWKHYGLAFIPLYLAAGAFAQLNRFEVEAGLEDGGYV